jgi:hypothetical protein
MQCRILSRRAWLRLNVGVDDARSLPSIVVLRHGAPLGGPGAGHSRRLRFYRVGFCIVEVFLPLLIRQRFLKANHSLEHRGE